MDLEIIVPAKNEQTNLVPLVKELYSAFKGHKINFRIKIIVDKSSDKTLLVARKLSETLDRVRYEEKDGKPGKGYSLIQGAQNSKYDNIAFIDADMQYPPSALPVMAKRLVDEDLGVVVANRKKYSSSTLSRKIISRLNKFFFGKLLHGLDTDTQSGLKVFKKKVFDAMDKDHVGSWTFDMPLLITCKELGMKIANHDIEFVDRAAASSHISVFRASYQIGLTALKLKFAKHVFHVPHESEDIGHSVVYKKNKFQTHNKLPHHTSALYVINHAQKLVIFLILAAVVFLFVTNYLLALQIVIAVLTFIYFADFVLSALLVNRSLNSPPELTYTKKELDAISDDELPVYTILSPLYKESEILPHYIEAVKKIKWPKEKLDVILLLEEDDNVTTEVAHLLDLPDYFRIVVVPHSQPKTKPKACNYGLKLAKGEFTTIYDAEDRPDPYQLRKAYMAFRKSPDRVVCVQGKLNYFNKNHNLLTKFFTAEYSLWFEVILPSLQSINTLIPLGGTSNHFRTKILRQLHGWDPFNVTEDCDLGVRLFKKGYNTAIINSVTYEEANSNVGSWIRQRSRWIKGYMQTYFVHMRDPVVFFKDHKEHSFLFQLIIGLRMSFILINPFMWMMTASYFLFNAQTGAFIESLYPAPVFYMGVLTFIFGNFFYVYNYMIGLAAHKHWDLIKYVFFVPLYWILMSFAAAKAFYQLVFKPHYWEKTQHGLHLSGAQKKKFGFWPISITLPRPAFPSVAFPEVSVPSVKLPKVGRPSISLSSVALPTITLPFVGSILKLKKVRSAAMSPAVISGSVLVASTMISNLANFVYNAYLGREVDLAQFGTVSLISNIFAISAVFSGSLGKTTAYKTAYVFGKLNLLSKDFYHYVKKFTWLFSAIATLTWILLTPVLADFFNEKDIIPFLLFTPYWMISFVGTVNSGFLSGAQRFSVLGVSILVESFSKVLFAVLAVETGYTQLVYGVIPAAVMMSFVYEAFIVYRIKPAEIKASVKETIDNLFPVKFYLTSIFTKVSSVVFLSADVILAKHFLSPIDAGKYALLSLSGKIVYFLGNLSSQFILPVVSKEEGKSKNSKSKFYLLLGGSALLSVSGILGIGFLGNWTVPILFGDKAVSIIGFLPQYTLAMFAFSVSVAFVTFHQIKKEYVFTVVPLVFAVLEIFFISSSSPTIKTFVGIISVLSFIQLAVVLILHVFYPSVRALTGSVIDYLNQDVFAPAKVQGKKRILVFNWRDTKHIWWGGAEIYVHELAKRWVRDGHEVTLFCGNDRKNKGEEVIDGVKIIRRGGFFTVYIWAVFYYLFKLRKECDVVVDSENGIPFFTPLFVTKPVVLLIHHVHKDIVLGGLKLPKYLLPFALIAKSLETWFMPFIYRNAKIVAVSPSTKSDLESLGFKNGVSVVNPGVEEGKFKKSKKTKVPSILYLGRLKHYKSIDTLIKAHKIVTKKYPKAKLMIAGFGDARKHLEKIVKKLDLKGKVKFLGRVTEKQKVKLLGKTWVFAYPSTMEGWGISVVEASASGTAVVASDVPGLRDSVRNPSSGLLVEQGNPVEFSNAIVKLIEDDKLRTKFETQGREWANTFTWDRSADKFLDVIEGKSEK